MASISNELLDELMTHRPPPPRRRHPHRQGGEAEVLRACLRWLVTNPRVAYVERRNTGAMKFADGAFMRFGKPGSADIWCMLDDGTHVEIECKRSDGKGVTSAAQQHFADICRAKGIPFAVVKNTDELDKFIGNLLVTRTR